LENLLNTGLAFFGAAMLGALLPLQKRWSRRGLHQFVSIAAGIFLGSLFLHLLPELATGGHAELAPSDGHDHAAHSAPESMLPWAALLGGFLLLFVVERVWLQGRESSEGHDSHSVLLSATFVGLALHAFTMGVGLSAILENSSGGWSLLASLLPHKAAEAFSLAAVMNLAHVSRGRSLSYLMLFATITPLGLILGSQFAALGGAAAPLLGGFACGTFLYVAVCDLLPEVFHDTDRSWTKLGWVLLGIGIVVLTLPGIAEGVPGFLQTTFTEATILFEQMALYLLFGFLIAGVLSQVLKPELLTRHLSKNDAASVLKASLIGAPLPLCSCSVLPVAVSLRKAGASKGATSAFLISTPETGVDSVSVTWALLDPVMAIARPIGAVLSAIFTGGLVSFFVNKGWDRQPPAAASKEPPKPVEGDCCATEEHVHAEPEPTGFIQRVLRFAYVDMLDDLAGLLLVGLLLSGVLAAVLPEGFFENPVTQGFGGMLLMLLVGIPIYVCAAASTPIAATMIGLGLSPGAALVFLLASPASNLASLVALSKSLGKRVTIMHVIGLALSALSMGLLVDALYPLLGIEASIAHAGDHSMMPGWVSRGSAILLAALVVLSFLRTRLGVRIGGGPAVPPKSVSA
jgi:hypothetical protein